MRGSSGQPLASAIFGDYTSLVYLTPILGGIIADRFAGRRVALFAGGVTMSIGHFLMAFEGAFLFALLALIIGVGLFKGNIASQVGALYKGNDLRRAMAFQIFYIAINVSVIAAPLISGTLGEKVGWHYGFGTAGIVMVLGVLIFLAGRPHLPVEEGESESIAAAKTLGTIAAGRRSSRSIVIGIVFLAGIFIALAGPDPALFLADPRPHPGREDARAGADPADPGHGRRAPDQPADLQRLSGLGRPAFPARPSSARRLPTSWMITHRRDPELLDAGRGRGLLQMVRHQAARARRARQDDHRQLLHHRRRPLPLHRGADPGRRQDRPVLAAHVPPVQQHRLRLHPAGQPRALLARSRPGRSTRPSSASIISPSSRPTRSSARSASSIRAWTRRPSGCSTSAPRRSASSPSSCSSCSCRGAWPSITRRRRGGGLILNPPRHWPGRGTMRSMVEGSSIFRRTPPPRCAEGAVYPERRRRRRRRARSPPPESREEFDFRFGREYWPAPRPPSAAGKTEQ